MFSIALRASAILVLFWSAFTCELACGQAPNDSCATAIAAFDGNTSGNNNMSSTGPDPVPACGTMSNDVWYSYQATCSGVVTATLCTPGTNFDTMMAAWSGSCGCLSELACNDDFCVGNKSAVTFNSVAGTVYYLSIGGFDGGAGNFTMNISCTPVSPPPFVPPNDHCFGALSITEGAVTAGTTQNSTTGGGGVCPGDPVGSCSVMSNDVWYIFVASCSGQYEARTCVGATSFDTVVAVWDGAGGCGNLVEIGCNDTGGCAIANQGNSAIATWNATAGNLYYISVGGFIGLTGTFDLVVGPTGLNPVLAFINAGPGTIGYTVVGGPPSGLAFTAITVNQGMFPNGAFFGIDISITELTDQINIGFPFLVNLGPCGGLTIGPVGGAPSGITLYAVTLTAPNGVLVLHSTSAPVTATIP
jgi:hypothetical protein